jgi:hypothetical protein
VNGLGNAWKKEKNFDWAPVLQFCKIYLQDTRFVSGQLVISDDGWNADAQWVMVPSRA